MLAESSGTPNVWSCKWLNDSSVEGYRTGQAVWLNTQSAIDILNSKYDEVMQLVLDNSTLKAMYSRVN